MLIGVSEQFLITLTLQGVGYRASVQGKLLVLALGFGMVLIKKEVFQKVEKPWFWFEQTDKGGTIGEDIYFCVKAFDKGFKTVLDHDLSKHIRHIGTYEYGWDDV